MTQQEHTGKRSLLFSVWIREKLPDSKTGFMVTNQDWIFWNYKERKLMLIEEKTRKGNISPWFKRLIQEVLNPALTKYCKEAEIDYRGYHLVQFENESPTDGKIYLDYREVSEEELQAFLSMS